MSAAAIPVNDSASGSVLAELIPVETYLSSMYHPDRDYIEGRLVERNVGEKPHARIQRFFIRTFDVRAEEWKLEVLPEQRVQVGPERYRVADICVTRADEEDAELIVRKPPVLCIEVLSREDRMSEMQQRVDDYLLMGVKNVWLIDPWRKKAYTAVAEGGLQSVGETLTVPGTLVCVSVGELFAELDRFAAAAEIHRPRD